ncbi:CRISPR-associated endoribonuclease Cas2 [bacterium HR24]|jgi:CRISPR-associated protein Cas2|nr:CRISPR-associated endoribonuclease Cas2 [bacterium HR24]
MYVVLVYDVEQKRVNKVCQYLRRHLFWVQRSVFEGDLSEGRLEKVKAGLRRIINPRYDSVYIYKVRERRWVDREVLGVEAAPIDQVI